MITPRFTLSQDDNLLIIKIRAPYCSLRELDVSIDENVFLFFCRPYYLRLSLPGEIIENDCKENSFDSDTGEFTLCYNKKNPGEHFEDLELITKFLTTKVDASYGSEDKRKIYVVSNEGLTEEPEIDLDNGFGFALQSHKNFIQISSEFDDVFEINPSEVKIKERRKLRLQYEQGKFNIDHYLADFIEDEEIAIVISQKSPWKDLTSDSVSFTEKELDFLKDLPNINFNLTEQQIRYCHNGLLDILYAYCYDRRTLFYEENVESGWTIVKLAATFCWLDVFDQSKDALICSYRRSVIYPLYRNFQLSQAVFQDLKDLIKSGEKSIIKCLIDMYYIFLGGDCCRYILNNLFIKDYIMYVMKWDKDKWQDTVTEISIMEIKKEHLGLNLAEIEQGFCLQKQFSNLNIMDSNSDSDDSSDDSDESSDESASDTDSSCPELDPVKE